MRVVLRPPNVTELDTRDVSVALEPDAHAAARPVGVSLRHLEFEFGAGNAGGDSGAPVVSRPEGEGE
jgi:hypothetical protein